MELSLQVGPKFLKDICRRIDSNLDAGFAGGVAYGTVVGIGGAEISTAASGSLAERPVCRAANTLPVRWIFV
jgi:hypothetical protein